MATHFNPASQGFLIALSNEERQEGGVDGLQAEAARDFQGEEVGLLSQSDASQ